MSLKLFHLIFIGLSILLSAGCALWASLNYRVEAHLPDLILAVCSGLTAVALVFYEIWFLRKTRGLIL